MHKPLTTEEFIEKAKQVHGDLYDYSLVNYINAHTKIKIYCNSCKKYFWQTPDSHSHKHGCPICAQNKRNKKRRKTTEEFIKKVRNIHGDKYDYSLVKYINAKTKIKIICKTHGIFYQTPDSHIRSNGCPICGYMRLSDIKTMTLNNFIKKAKEVHGDRFDYSKTNYKKSNIKIKIYCKNCKRYFWQTPASHLHNSGCPFCRKSKGEEVIEIWLNKYNINYIQEKRFKNCRNKLPLSFDFYLSKYNMLIEYDGIFHYKSVNVNGNGTYSNLKYIKNNDKIKNIFCKKNDIPLLRIPYWKYNDIEKLLLNSISERQKVYNPLF